MNSEIAPVACPEYKVKRRNAVLSVRERSPAAKRDLCCLDGGWLDTMIGGWQLATISNVQNGIALPLTITDKPCLAGSRSMYVPHVSPETKGSVRSWLGGNYSSKSYLDPIAFAYPLAFQFDKMSRLAANLRAPAALNFEVSGLKSFRLLDVLSLQSRGVTFNLPNYTQFDHPGVTHGAGSSGTITGSDQSVQRNSSCFQADMRAEAIDGPLRE